MLLTSSQANNLLRKLKDDLTSLKNEEAQKETFLCAMGEDFDSIRPDYDYEAFQKTLSQKELQICALKHAINVFNTTTVLDGSSLTIDQALIRLPQLQAQKEKLMSMKSRPKKAREEIRRYGQSSVMADYRYTNYDPVEAAADYEKLCKEIAGLQNALDMANTTLTMEIDLEETA